MASRLNGASIRTRKGKIWLRFPARPCALRSANATRPFGKAGGAVPLPHLASSASSSSLNTDPPVLAQCVEHLEGISLDRTELDTKGVAFEEFMGGFFKGDFGQYFTP